MKAKVNGLLEMALYVSDLEQAHLFYADLFGFKLIKKDDRLRALNVDGRQVLLLFKRGGSQTSTFTVGGVIPYHDGYGAVHMAFSIDPDAFGDWEERLNEKGISIESIVHFNRGRSLYFRDPDQHLIELATTGIWEGIQ